jgi:signal transduction histidine kinase
MEQLIHPVSIQPNALMLQHQAEVENSPEALTADDYGLAKVIRERLENDIPSARYESFLSALYRGEDDTVLVITRSEAALRKSQEELRQLSMQLLSIQESERQRIAADLHDGIGQSLSLIKLSLESVMQQIKAGEHQGAMESLQHLIHKAKETMDELHRTTMDLRPSMLNDLGIIPTLSWFFREFELAWRGRKINREISIAESDVPVSLKATIFRILQEAMNNIVKHANADIIRVSLRKANGILKLSIEDNGCGFDLSGVSVRPDSGSGFGLLTMKERARSSAGTFEIKSIIAQGTHIQISWIFADSADEQHITQPLNTRKLSTASNR